MEKVIGLALDDEGENWLVEHGTSACHDSKPMSAEGNSVRPVRVQRKRSKGWKMPENTVYVGRPTIFGNPYTVSDVCSIEMCLQKYESYLYSNLMASEDHFNKIMTLKGKNLACFCPINKPCHADILLEIANRE